MTLNQLSWSARSVVQNERSGETTYTKLNLVDILGFARAAVLAVEANTALLHGIRHPIFVLLVERNGLSLVTICGELRRVKFLGSVEVVRSREYHT